MNKADKIYVAGHCGMVGSAIVRALKAEGYTNIVCRTSAEVDLRNQQQVNDFFAIEKPNYVFLAAAKVGGILANNTYRAEFLYDNLMIEANIINAAHQKGITNIVLQASDKGVSIYEKMGFKEYCEFNIMWMLGKDFK